MLHHLLPRILFNLQRTVMYYVVIAGLFFALWLWWRARPGKRLPLQAKHAPAAQMRRELFTSIGSVIVFSSYLRSCFSSALANTRSSTRILKTTDGRTFSSASCWRW